MSIEALQPERVWYYFARLCEIPRPSKHEDKIITYVERFAKEQGLEYDKDSVGNLVIRKNASAGKENLKGVVLQSHLDMVPQKNNDKVHDFTKDPITPMVDGDWVRADKTTLGADNGMGVAAILAVLEDKNLLHGPLEAFFTIDEETGMTGAFNLSSNFLKGRTLLNLDSEEDEVICVGCAGGMDGNIQFHYIDVPVPKETETFLLEVKGLQGGHSGIDIHKERGNAIKILNRILWYASKSFGLRLSHFEGGNMRNAIPRESKAIFTLDKGAIDDFKAYLQTETDIIKEEFKHNEPSLQLILSDAEHPFTLLQENVQHNLLNAIYACPNGVIRMSTAYPGVVETSTNLAILKMKNGLIDIHCLLRSSIESAKQNVANMMDSLFTLAGADVSFDGEYPGWKPDPESEIQKTTIAVFNELNGRDPEVEVIHAGLECGIIGANCPGMDMVSFGPTITGAHSPDERVEIKTVEKFYKTLVRILEKIS